MTEREPEDKENKKKGIYQTFLQIIKRLKEIVDKLRGSLTDEEKRELKQEQEVLKNKKEQLVDDFKKTPHGRKSEQRRQRWEKELREEVEELSKATDTDYEDKKRSLQQKLAKLDEEIADYKDPSRLVAEEHRGIVAYELRQEAEKAKAEYQQILRDKGGAEKQGADIDKRRDDEGVRMLMAQRPDLTEEQARDIIRASRLQGGRTGYFGFDNPREIEMMQKPNDPEGIRLREKYFNEYYDVITQFSNQFYGEALRNMGLDMINRWASYIRILTSIPGDEGQKIVNEFQARTTLRQMIHNAVAAIERGAAKPDKFGEMMESFTPELFDELFKEEEAQTAAHLYEAAVRNIRSENDNWVPPEKMFYSAKNKESEVDMWVRKRFERYLRIKYGDEEFEKNWSRQRMKRAMYMGKGYEMVNLRMPEMVARGRIPLRYQARGEVVSPAYEDFVRPLDMFEHLVEKFQFYDDPGAHFYLYILSNGKLKFGSSRTDIKNYFRQSYNVDPANLRMNDIVNYLGAGGSFTRSGWRRELATEDIKDPEQRKWFGLAFRLAGAGDTKEKKRILREELERNPVGILREAELMDGEILDPVVKQKVLAQFASVSGLSREDVTKEIQKAEENLIILTQIEADQDKGRKGRLVFTHLKDERERRLAEAYFKAIKNVLTEEVNWQTTIDQIKKGKKEVFQVQEPRIWQGKKAGDSLLDYLAQKDFPYAPGGFEDTPWSDLHFAKMGHKGYARRIRDYNAAYQTMVGMLKLQNNFAKLREPGDLVRQMNDIWEANRDYDKVGARARMAQIYEGICRFNQANFVKRFLPFPLAEFSDFLGDNINITKKDKDGNEKIIGFKPTSYAKQVYGYAANSWRGIDIRNMLAHARLAGHITKEQERELMKTMKCTFPWILLEAVTRLSLPTLFIVIISFINELKSQLEEQAKQQG